MTNTDGQAAAQVAQDVAAIVVSFNTGPVLLPALRALLSQPELTELVLVNNGNPAATEALLQTEAAAEPRLKLIRGQGNVGFAAGSNLGARASQATKLLFLNPDVVLPPNALGQLLAELAELPFNALLSPLLVNSDFTEQRGSRRSVLTPWRALVEWLQLYRLAPAHPYFKRFNRVAEPLPLHTHAVDVTSGAAMLLSRALFEQLGGFDERYFLHVEDVDLCVSLLKAGGSSYIAPNVRVVHYASSSKASLVVVEWHKSRGFCRYFRKQFPSVYPPGFITVVNALVWCRFCVRLPWFLLRGQVAQDDFVDAGVPDVLAEGDGAGPRR